MNTEIIYAYTHSRAVAEGGRLCVCLDGLYEFCMTFLGVIGRERKSRQKHGSAEIQKMDSD